MGGAPYRGNGAGILAGTYPDGLTRLEGVPTEADVFAFARAPGAPSNGVLLAKGRSLPSGEWELRGLPRTGRFNVLAAKYGQRDVVVPDVAPFIPLELNAPAVFYTPLGATRSLKLVAEGGEPPYTYAVVSGTLPTGVTLVDDTLVSASPTAPPGVYPITVEVTDARSGTAQHEMAVELVLLRFWVAFPELAYLRKGEAASYSPSVSGGYYDYTFAVTSGVLPPGIALNASTGELSGTPTTDGVYAFEIEASDSSGPTTYSAEFSVLVSEDEPHKFWRIYITESVSYGSIVEMEFSTLPGGPDLCSGGTAFSNGNYNSSHGPENAFDGSLSDPPVWASNSSSPSSIKWIGYEFPSPVVVGAARVCARTNSTQHPVEFCFQYSDDGVTFFNASPVYNRTSWPAATFVEYDFST